jgi:hypothetical protein
VDSRLSIVVIMHLPWFFCKMCLFVQLIIRLLLLLMFPNFYLRCGSCFLGRKSLGVCNNTWLLMCF